MGHNNYIGYIASLLQWHVQTRDKWIALATFLPNCCLEDVAGEWMCGCETVSLNAIHPLLINWNRIPHIPMGNNKDKLLSDILTLLVRTSLRDDRTDRRDVCITWWSVSSWGSSLLRHMVYYCASLHLSWTGSKLATKHNKLPKCNIESCFFGQARKKASSAVSWQWRWRVVVGLESGK